MVMEPMCQDSVAYEGGPVFAFAETSAGSNQFDVTIDTGFTGILTPGLQEANSVWYGKDELLRTFTFTFSAVVNGLAFEQEFTANLGNVSPHIPAGTVSTMKVLVTEQLQAAATGFLMSIYDESTNSEDIQLGDSVNATGFPNNVVTVGTGFTPSKRGVADGYIADAVFGLEQTVLQQTTCRIAGFWDALITPGLMLNSSGFTEYQEPQGITNPFWTPPGTYIVSKNLVTVGGEDFLDITFNKPISFLGSPDTNGGISLIRPATLNIDQQLTVVNATDVEVIDESTLWDECPPSTFIPGPEVFGVNQTTEG